MRKTKRPPQIPIPNDLVSTFSVRESTWRRGWRPPEVDTSYPRSAMADWDPEDDHGDRDLNG